MTSTNRSPTALAVASTISLKQMMEPNADSGSLANAMSKASFCVAQGRTTRVVVLYNHAGMRCSSHSSVDNERHNRSVASASL